VDRAARPAKETTARRQQPGDKTTFAGQGGQAARAVGTARAAGVNRAALEAIKKGLEMTILNKLMIFFVFCWVLG
jgi:hypothetical protein